VLLLLKNSAQGRKFKKKVRKKSIRRGKKYLVAK